jgi:hypothetical protein
VVIGLAARRSGRIRSRRSLRRRRRSKMSAQAPVTAGTLATAEFSVPLSKAADCISVALTTTASRTVRRNASRDCSKDSRCASSNDGFHQRATVSLPESRSA